VNVFCSTVIPTVNRPTLTAAVQSVLDQRFEASGFEVIVVNDSGGPLPGADWLDSPHVQLIHTNRRERSVARNAGAAIARGQYVHFLDDDDVMLPGALAAFWEAEQNRPDGVVWLYGSYQAVDNEGRLVDEFHPGITGNVFALLVAGEGIPFQASLLRTDCLFRVGGFDSTPAIIGVEDRDVGRRIALVGEVAHVPTVVARIRIGEAGSTTNWTTIAEGDRLGREKALRSPGAWGRLRASVSSSYLRGRVSRAYVASSVWNLRRGALLAGAGRMCEAAALANGRVFSPRFWRGVVAGQGEAPE
jgi:glycosyltransferase involved in cell wall biosynthesis